MIECVICQKDVDPEHCYTDFGGGWCQVVIQCPECGAQYVGDIQLEHFTLDSDAIDYIKKGE